MCLCTTRTNENQSEVLGPIIQNHNVLWLEVVSLAYIIVRGWIGSSCVVVGESQCLPNQILSLSQKKKKKERERILFGFFLKGKKKKKIYKNLFLHLNEHIIWDSFGYVPQAYALLTLLYIGLFLIPFKNNFYYDEDLWYYNV